MKLNIIVCVFAVIIGSIACDSNELEANFEKIKSKLPEGIEIPETLKNITMPSIDDAKAVLKEKCEKVSGGEEAYAAVEEAAETMKECAMNLVNVEQLQKDIEEAQPKGELDTVFNRYCRNRSIAIDCLNNFTHVLEPCLDSKEKEGQTTFVKIFTNLLNFVCYKDGDQIALFIAEKGPECFSDKKNQLFDCFNSTFNKYIPTEAEAAEPKLVPTTLPQLVMGIEQCHDMDALQVCVVKHLEKCEESTPANLVESMFKFVRNETVCGDIAPVQKLKSNSAAANAMSSILLAGIASLFSLRYLH